MNSCTQSTDFWNTGPGMLVGGAIGIALGVAILLIIFHFQDR